MLNEQLFWGASTAVVNEIEQNQTPAVSLYHYTSAEGLIGIVKSNALRFGDTTFMNDGSENFHGMMVFLQALRNYTSNKAENIRQFASELEYQFEHVSAYLKPYIFCMSSEQNLLNQWRDYGVDIVPYSIEIDAQSIRAANSYNFPVYLAKVIYDVSYQDYLCRRLCEILHERANYISSEATITLEEKNNIVQSAASEVCWVTSRFKNPAFQAEAEWRLISHAPALTGVVKPHFRASKMGIIPYYEYRRRGEVSLQLPIRSVMVGPSPYSNISAVSTRHFLEQNGYAVPVHVSQIPIRK